MDTEAVHAAVEAERLSLCALLEKLDDAEWATPSLCSGWTVRDVAAHLTTTTRTTPLSMVTGMIRARGDFHRMTDRRARARAAAATPAELVTLLRESAASARRMPGSGPLDPLVDLLVHGQDIARPLGRDRPMPRAAAVAALSYVAGNRFYHAPERLDGLRLVASDAPWTSGDGQEVRGTAADLLLVATGRPAGLAGLSGPGLDVLTARMSAR
ncbi:maleylpyruvate isomerase family mycothiol-dependent enzyme [Nonomuraea sp. NN258]|uniref:maleylpyruvate isomerase family mycothiol-dependent enzyme n=1 Tax=Nonomuraea antri TaxID=2730852 RepID=UPI00156A12CB|nr:maleylpyruvate isomerase family mycothiol-dependent enzyme [Nonomuraea antri]NRQ40272.1 maleylpyruvate isomerase family mycothiol-dependent enzyme [Nonomuraea antri]